MRLLVFLLCFPCLCFAKFPFTQEEVDDIKNSISRYKQSIKANGHNYLSALPHTTLEFWEGAYKDGVLTVTMKTPITNKAQCDSLGYCVIDTSQKVEPGCKETTHNDGFFGTEDTEININLVSVFMQEVQEGCHKSYLCETWHILGEFAPKSLLSLLVSESGYFSSEDFTSRFFTKGICSVCDERYNSISDEHVLVRGTGIFEGIRGYGEVKYGFCEIVFKFHIA